MNKIISLDGGMLGLPGIYRPGRGQQRLVQRGRGLRRWRSLVPEEGLLYGRLRRPPLAARPLPMTCDLSALVVKSSRPAERERGRRKKERNVEKLVTGNGWCAK